MNQPRIGFGLPVFGPHATPENIALIAGTVDRLGFYAVSVTDRVLYPATPEWDNWAGLPPWPVLDTIEALTWAAAHTKRVRLASQVLISLFQPPVILARRLATLDLLSGGRVDVGLGQGWLAEEFTAVGVPMSRRGAGFEEHLAVMRACWGPDPVSHDGPNYQVPLARIGPKPVQARMPVFIGAVAPAAVERAARISDGFIAALRSWETTNETIATYRAAGGGGPVILRMMAPALADDAAPESIVPEMQAQLATAAAAGIDEVHWDFTLAQVPPDRQVLVMEALAAALAELASS